MKRVMIVEDEQTLAFALRESLIDEGYEVDVAESGEEALQIFTVKRHEVVVTDLRMPGITGIQLLREIKKIAGATEVIMVSAYGSMEAAIEALRLRAFDFIIKPYTVDYIRLSIRRALERAEREKQRPTNGAAKLVSAPPDRKLGLSISYDSDVSEPASYYLDICTPGRLTNITYFEADPELMEGRNDFLAEVKGFIRNGLFKRQGNPCIIKDLKDYLTQTCGAASGWRFLLASHDDKGGKLRLLWAGTQQHLIFSRRTGRAHSLLSHPDLKKLRSGSGEFQIRFTGGDSLLFLPRRLVDYLNSRMGLVQFVSVVESSFRNNGSDVAGPIRKAIRSDHDGPAPGIIVVSAKDSLNFTNRLSVSIAADRGNLVELKDLAEQVCDKCGCSEDETFDVVTALNEALLNSMSHAYGVMMGDIKVLFTRKGRRLTVEVRDTGRGFAYRPVLEPEESYDWITRREGRGLSIINKLMDEVDVVSSPGKGTIVRMSKKISRESEKK